MLNVVAGSDKIERALSGSLKFRPPPPTPWDNYSDRRRRGSLLHVAMISPGEYVYKIKNPVNIGFLDFSTLEKRRHYCER